MNRNMELEQEYQRYLIDKERIEMERIDLKKHIRSI